MASGQIVAQGTFADESFTNTDNGGPGGATGPTWFGIDILMSAGSTIGLRRILGAIADVSANLWNSSGSSTLDASCALGLQVLNEGSGIKSLCGHDYLTSAVPEPAGPLLMLCGMGVLFPGRRVSRG